MKRTVLFRALALMLALLLPALAAAEQVEVESVTVVLEDTGEVVALEDLESELPLEAGEAAAELGEQDLFDVDDTGLLPEEPEADAPPAEDSVLPEEPEEGSSLPEEGSALPEEPGAPSDAAELPDGGEDADSDEPAEPDDAGAQALDVVPEETAGEGGQIEGDVSLPTGESGEDAPEEGGETVVEAKDEAAPDPGQSAGENPDGESAPAEAEEGKPADGEDGSADGEDAPAEAAQDGDPEGEAGEENADGEGEDPADIEGLSRGELGASTASFPTTLTLGVKETYTLDASAKVGGTLAYISSNTKILTVNRTTGKVTPLKAGTAMVAAVNAKKQYVICTIKVLNAPSAVKLSKSILVLDPKASGKLAAALPSNSASKITFTSSSTAVATVDASGAVRAVSAGSCTITASTYNGKKASCKVVVLKARSTKTLSLNRTTAKLGRGESLTLKPTIDSGSDAVFAWASSNTKIATVSDSGVVKTLGTGTVKIGVKTHNGLLKICTIAVVNAPSKVALSASTLSLKVGGSARLTAKLPSGTASALTWASANTAVATVDSSGLVTAVGAGTTTVAVRTFNGKTASCTVKVATLSPKANSTAKMVANLRASSSIGAKREAIAGIVQLLINTGGYEPAFAAGVAANVLSEGSYGYFESSRYVTSPKNRPRYFAYLDGGNYYKNGVLTTIYASKEVVAAHKGDSRYQQRFASENYYLNNYSKKYAWQVNLNNLEAMLVKLEKGGWVGKFGLGVTQWTGSRTKGLVKMYRKHAGSASTITQSQVIAAENEMILSELKGGYAFVYNNWKSANSGKLNSAAAAASAASIFCLKYEVPANKETQAANRAEKARTLYNIMMG